MSLHFHAEVDARDLDVSLEVGPTEKVAILGPNGSGKTTVLSVLAGLLRPDRGFASIDGRTLFSAARPGETDSWEPAHRRGTALLAQDALLFPHLTALDNVAFGPQSAGVTRRRARERARSWLAEVDASELASHKPAQLSGGQAQRVAVARALAADPRLLLLDEPMAALDVAVVPAVRQMLRRVLQDRAAIIVTHDILDALLLADRVIVLADGRVVEEGPTAEVLSRPRSSFGAQIAGLNMVSGQVNGTAVRTTEGFVIEGIADEVIPSGAPAVAVFDPSAVGVYRSRPEGSPRNAFAVTIQELEPRGSQVRVRTGAFSADVMTPVIAELDLAPGTDVVFTVKASEVAIYRV